MFGLVEESERRKYRKTDINTAATFQRRQQRIFQYRHPLCIFRRITVLSPKSGLKNDRKMFFPPAKLLLIQSDHIPFVSNFVGQRIPILVTRPDSDLFWTD